MGLCYLLIHQERENRQGLGSSELFIELRSLPHELLSFLAEGIRKLFSGASMAASRGAMVTVGQVMKTGPKMSRRVSFPHECFVVLLALLL